ncbi:MAG: hypothetical protein DPW09_31970 [Anaerolineae bacterium]|nr:hypothetical protein [Anaerolineales bacterium]MCQ3978067.1 hypothetical protein [Anaerolineae bacterium]
MTDTEEITTTENSLTLTVVEEMTETEARLLVEEIKQDISAVGAKLLELHERQGWRALGYSSWRECVTAEFEFGQSHVYRLLDFARIERNLSPIGENGYPLPAGESVARPLATLEDPDLQRQVWQQAVDTAPEGRVTARHVQTIVDEVRGNARPTRVRCRYWLCSGDANRENGFTVPADTLTCTRCGAVHEPGMVGHHLAPGEEERLNAIHQARAAATRQQTTIEESSEFTCPRCGQRSVRVNGHAMCLNEACGAAWDTRTAYADEIEALDLELHARRAELKGEAVTIINRLPVEALEIFAGLLTDIRHNYLAASDVPDAIIPGL